MKAHERIAMLYALGIAGAAGVAIYRGRQGQALMQDVLVHGVVAGTALNVAGWLLLESNEAEALANPFPNPMALLNKGHDLGKMGKAAVDLLKNLDDDLYNDFKSNGVKVAAVPANPSHINQDAS